MYGIEKMPIKICKMWWGKMIIHGELSVDLNPFNSADAHGDKDRDGLDNLWEYENGTMINDADINHDGINDGEGIQIQAGLFYD